MLDRIMMTCRSLLAVLLVTASTVACSDSPATPTSPSSGGGSLALTAGQLAGTWTLTSIQVPGEVVQPVPAGATYSISFADSRLSTRVDCNTCSGSFTLQGNTLTAGPNLACTRAACPTMAFESVYLGVLGGESTAALSGSTLVLASTRGSLYFSR
jgi:heat shock protein HslJ